MILNKINDYSVFSIQYKTLKENIENICTNCLLPGKIIRDAIEKKDTYYQKIPEGLLIFIDEGNQYSVFYFLDQSKPFPILTSNKLLLIEELDSENRRKEYLEQQTKKLKDAGFKLAAYNYQFQINLAEQKQLIQNEFLSASNKLNNAGFTSSCNLTNYQIDQVINLWKSSLRPTDIPYDHLNFNTQSNQYVVCVLDQMKNVCGTLWWTYKGNICEIRHIVTRPDCYRKGISNYTMLYSFLRAMETGSKIVVSYVDKENNKSIFMHLKAGMKKNGKISLQFINENI